MHKTATRSADDHWAARAIMLAAEQLSRHVQRFGGMLNGEQISSLQALLPSITEPELRGYVAAFNSGDVNTMRKFVESSLIVNPERSTDERLKSYMNLFEDHGPLSLVSVDSASATKVILGMRSKRGTLSLTLAASDADPMRAASVRFAFMEPPR
jgi:hypothetical protein